MSFTHIGLIHLKYDEDYAKEVKAQLSEEDIQFLKNTAPSRAICHELIRCLDVLDGEYRYEMREETHRRLTAMHNIGMFNGKIESWDQTGFNAFSSACNTVESEGIMYRTADGYYYFTDNGPRLVEENWNYRQIDRFHKLVDKFDPNNKEEEPVMTEVIEQTEEVEEELNSVAVDVMKQVGDALAAVEKVKELEAQVAELNSQVEARDKLTNRLQSRIAELESDAECDNVTIASLRDDISDLETEVELYKPCYEVMKAVKELNI